MGHYQCVGNTCTYAIPRSHLAKTSPRLLVEQALVRVILALPSLQVGIANEDTQKPHFVQLGSIDLATHLSWHLMDMIDETQYTEALLHAIETQHETSWLNARYESPWKLIVFERPIGRKNTLQLDIMFAVHHALSDGLSTSIFHTQLLEALNINPPMESLLEDNVLHLHSPSVIIPSQEELVPFRLSWTYMLSRLWLEFAPSWLHGSPQLTPWTGKPITEGKLVHVRLLELKPERVSRLLEKCRSNGTTLLPLLHSIILLSLSQRLSEQEAHAFTSATVISLRPYVDTKKLPTSMNISESMTDLVTAYDHFFGGSMVSGLRAASDDDIEPLLWSVARTIGAEVKEKVQTLPNDDVTGLLAWVNFEKRAKGLMGKPREATWELSNLGSMLGTCQTTDAADSPKWEITKSVFTQSAHVIGPAFCANVSGIVDGVLTITLTWQDETVEQSLMDGVKGDICAWFARLT